MTEDKLGSFNGKTVSPFWAGQEYLLPPSLLRAFEGSYEEVTEKRPEEATQKNQGNAPNNKATGPKENK